MAINRLSADLLRRALSQEAERRGFHRAEFLAVSRDLGRQLAGDPGTAGSTSLASLSSVSDLLSAAMEGGLVSRATEGSVSTFRLNAAAWGRLFNPRQPCFLRDPKCKPTAEQQLRGLSIAASFEQATPAAGVHLARYEDQFSEWMRRSPYPVGARDPPAALSARLRPYLR